MRSRIRGPENEGKVTPVSGVSTVTRDQASALAALKVKKPTEGHQLSLL
jgi:hypothetical protein